MHRRRLQAPRRPWALQAASGSLVSSVRERFSQFRDVALKRRCSEGALRLFSVIRVSGGGTEAVGLQASMCSMTNCIRAGSALNMHPLLCLPFASVTIETCSSMPRRQLLVSHVAFESQGSGRKLARFPSCGTRVGVCARAQKVCLTWLYLLPRLWSSGVGSKSVERNEQAQASRASRQAASKVCRCSVDLPARK